MAITKTKARPIPRRPRVSEGQIVERHDRHDEIFHQGGDDGEDNAGRYRAEGDGGENFKESDERIVAGENAVLVGVPERQSHDHEYHCPVHQADHQPEAKIAVCLRSISPPAAANHGLPADDGIKQDKAKAAEKVEKDQRDHHKRNHNGHNEVKVVSQMNGAHGILNFCQWVFGEAVVGKFGRKRGRAKTRIAVKGHQSAAQQPNESHLEPGAKAEGLEQHGANSRESRPHSVNGG